jgi:arginine decarboxylase
VPDDLSTLERDLAGHLLPQLLGLPVAAGLLGDQPALPGAAAAPPQRAADAPRDPGDITCDSDGKIDRFCDLKDVKRTLELHPLRPNEPYYLGFFLVGAYQEILATCTTCSAIRTSCTSTSTSRPPRITHVVRGDRTQEVLSYVEYFEPDLLARMRRHIERSLEEGRMSFEESALLQRRYEAGLAAYTYLSRESDAIDRPPTAPHPAPRPRRCPSRRAR